MMIADVGSSLNVIGMRSAVPAAGPSPGRTPISVPRMQPMVAKRRFSGESAVANPPIKCCSASTHASLHPQNAARQYHLQLPEDVRRAETPRERQNDGQPPRLLSQNPEEDDAEKEHRQAVAQAGQEEHHCHEGTEQAGYAGDSGLRREEIRRERDALAEGPADLDHRQGDDDHSQPEREEAGTGPE